MKTTCLRHVNTPALCPAASDLAHHVVIVLYHAQCRVYDAAVHKEKLTFPLLKETLICMNCSFISECSYNLKAFFVFIVLTL